MHAGTPRRESNSPTRSPPGGRRRAAITADTKVGSAVEKTIVRKNLILRLAVPRFFREGDEVTLSAIVQNYLRDEKTARVSLEVKGLELIEGATRDDRRAEQGHGAGGLPGAGAGRRAMPCCSARR